ncbi:hypothetical protein J6T93_06510 [bacterium]|nr:hypothetical protein [bacterium]
MDKLIKFDIGRSSKEKSLNVTFGSCGAELKFAAKLRGRDVLAFDCFTESLAFSNAESKKGHALFSGSTPYGSVKAEVFSQSAVALKIKAAVTLKNQAQLDAFYFVFQGRDGQKLITPFEGKKGWYSGEWPAPFGAFKEKEDALIFLPSPETFSKRQEWLWQLEAGERSLRFGTDLERSWPLNAYPRSRKLEFTFYIIGSSVNSLSSALSQAVWQLSKKESTPPPDLKKLAKISEQELKQLLDKLSAPPDQAEAPISFGKLIGAAFALAKNAKINGQKIPAAAEKVLQLYKKAPRFKSLPPANYPYPGTYKKQGAQEIELSELARAGYWLARWENEVGATGLKDELKALAKELIMKRHRGGFIPETIDAATNHVKKGAGRKRTSPWAVLFLAEIGQKSDVYTPLLNTLTRELIAKRSNASTEELIFAAKASNKAFAATKRETYRANGVKLAYRLTERQQSYQPHYLRMPVLGLLCGAESGDFSEAALPEVIPLFLRAQQVSGARMFEERAQALLSAIQKREAYFSFKPNSALPVLSQQLTCGVLEKCALLLAALETKETFGDIRVIPSQKRAVAFFESDEPKLEKELLGYKLTIDNTKEKRRIKITSESGRVWEPTLKKGFNQIELY